MRHPILAALAVISSLAIVPLDSSAQASRPMTREEALAAMRVYLSNCEAMAAKNPELAACVRDCSKAVNEAPAANTLDVWALFNICYKGLKFSEDQFRLMAASAKPTATPPAQVGAADARPAKPGAAGKAALRTDGAIDWGEYENEGILHDVFVGDYQRFNKGSFAIRVFLQYYLDAFEARCGAFLPPDAVVIVRKTIEVTTTGAFQQENVIDIKRITMAPKFVVGYQNYPSGAGAYAISGGPGDRNMVRNVLAFLQAWSGDIQKLFEVEACQGAAMLQLGENLARLTAGRPPIQSESNPEQRLAALRVRVPQTVEDADVRAKRARAERYWSADRAMWMQPPRTQTLQYPGGVSQVKVDYAAIAPDFAIPIPATADGQLVEINVEKSYGGRIRWIKLRRATPPYAIADFAGGEWPIFRKAEMALLEEGVRVLSCTYHSGGTLQTFNYWYGEAPKTVDFAALAISWEKHPDLVVQRAPRTGCPVVMPSR